MAAIATKKSGADRGVQLTFPAVFQEVYAQSGAPEAYEPEVPYKAPEVMIGDDEQARIHAQRKLDADRMAMAKVESTHNAIVRALTGHQGYHLPKPKLGQRKFANPSMGAFTATSARQDYRSAPFNYEGAGYEGRGYDSSSDEEQLEGGASVNRTAKGQAHSKAKLLDRVRQLNNIAAAKVAFQMPGATAAPVVPGAPAPAPAAATITPESILSAALPAQGLPPGAPFPGELSDSARLELGLGIQSINDALEPGIPTQNAKALSDVVGKSLRLVQLIVRVGSAGTPADIEQIIERIENPVDGLLVRFDAITDPRYNLDTTSPPAYEAATSAEAYWKATLEYLKGMMGVANRQPRDRIAASRTFLRDFSYSFARLQRVAVGAPPAPPPRAPFPGRRPGGAPPPPGAPPRPPPRPPASDSSRPPSSGGTPTWAYDMGSTPAGSVYSGWRGVSTRSTVSSLDTFSQPGSRREDSEHGSYGRAAAFDPRPRDTFGYASGAWFPTAGRAVGYFGEPAAEYGEAAPDALSLVESEDTAGTFPSDFAFGSSGLPRARAAPGSEVSGEGKAELSLRSIKDPETGEYDIQTEKKEKKGGAVAHLGLTRESLPTTLDGFKQLSAKLAASGGAKIRVNANSRYGSVRRNFIRKLGL
jgi:hypothetical protein